MRFIDMRPWPRLDAELSEFLIRTENFEYDLHNFGRALGVSWCAGVADTGFASLVLVIHMSERRPVGTRDSGRARVVGLGFGALSLGFSFSSARLQR